MSEQLDYEAWNLRKEAAIDAVLRAFSLARGYAEEEDVTDRDRADARATIDALFDGDFIAETTPNPFVQQKITAAVTTAILETRAETIATVRKSILNRHIALAFTVEDSFSSNNDIRIAIECVHSAIKVQRVSHQRVKDERGVIQSDDLACGARYQRWQLGGDLLADLERRCLIDETPTDETLPILDCPRCEQLQGKRASRRQVKQVYAVYCVEHDRKLKRFLTGWIHCDDRSRCKSDRCEIRQDTSHGR